MCFAEPARIVSIDGEIAQVVSGGHVSEVSLGVLRAGGFAATPGDWVLASLGLALEVIDESTGRALEAELAHMRSTTPEPAN